MDRTTLPVDGPSPRDAPLSYPGTPAPGAGVLTAAGFVRCGDDELDDVLSATGAPPLTARTAVVAVGSNANLAQVAAKLAGTGIEPAVPMAPAAVTGLRVGAVPMASRWGYVPAAPVTDEGAGTTLVVAWFDGAQRDAVDRTELGPYRREALASTPVLAGSGRHVEGCEAYVSRRGLLADRSGRPVDLVPQPELLAWMLAVVPALRAEVGATPERFVARARRDPVARARVHRLLLDAGLVAP